MTYTVRVQTNRVAGFRAFSYKHHGPLVHCGYLFAVHHELRIYIEDGDFQTLASSNGSASLLRLSLDKRKGDLMTHAPDFTPDDPLYPYERPVIEKRVPVTISGEALLRRVAIQPEVMYEIVMGQLHCPFAPSFDAWRDEAGPSALRSFWPSLPNDAGGLDYVFTPYGLAMEGPVKSASDSRDVLLLPAYPVGATGGDAAWKVVSDDEKVGTHVWKSLDAPGDKPFRPNTIALIDQLAADAPDPKAWPVSQPRWAMLRWRLITPHSQPFVEHCFADRANDVLLKRSAANPDSGDTFHADLVCQLWVSVKSGQARIEHGGMVCAITGTAMQAFVNWNEQQRNSVLTAVTARAALSVNVGAAPLAPACKVLRQTLRTSTAPASASRNLSLSWKLAQQSREAKLTLASTGMLCAGTTEGTAGMQPPSATPGWLMLDEGCIQLAPEALPMDPAPEDWDKERPAATLRAAAAESTEVFRGGVPLGSLGGPSGLTAWVAGGPGKTAPQVTLCIGEDAVQLDLFDAILIWRTGGWWACDTTASPSPNKLRLPPIVAPFIDAFSAQAANRGEADNRLKQAVGKALFPAIWVGRAGVAAAKGWTLDIKSGGQLTLTLPAESVRSNVLWSAFKDTYLAQTTPNGGQALGVPLLDPFRGHSPLEHTQGEALKLVLSACGLLALEAPRYASPDKLAQGWKSLGGEYFHPNITGLSLNAGGASYRYRHGSIMLADGYLRAKLDGSLGDATVTTVLDSARPRDDVGIEAISLAPKATDTFQLQGWLAAPQKVAINEVAWCLGGDDPTMSMTAYGGADGKEKLKVRIGSSSDGFETPVAVVTDGARSYLTAKQGNGKLLRNFGQSLAVQDQGRAFRDGAGRDWTPFANGVRAVGPQGQCLLTQQRVGVLSCGELGAVELGLCLADFNVGNGDRSGNWDLSGPLDQGKGTTPRFGPFWLLPDGLNSASGDAAEVILRLGGPVDGNHAQPLAAAGKMLLKWTASAGGWTLSPGSDPTFEWRIGRLPGSVPSIALIAGRLVEMDEQWHIVVNRVALHTEIGEVCCTCTEVKLNYLFEDGVCVSFSADIKTDEKEGIAADFTLVYHLQGQLGWQIKARQPLRWPSDTGGEVVVLLDPEKAGAISFNSGNGQWQTLRLAQANAQRWLVLASTSEGVELSGCLERDASPVTQLRLRYGWTEKITDLQRLTRWFGPVLDKSWVRLNGTDDWHSRRWVGNAALRICELGGQLVFDSDYAFRFEMGGGVVQTMKDRVHCFFNSLKLDTKDHVADGVLPALVRHAYHTGDPEQPVFSLQVPQTIHLSTTGDKVCMSASGIFLVCPSTKGDQPPQLSPQILYEQDDALGVCYGDSIIGKDIKGALLRIALRTGKGNATLKVPAHSLADLELYPLMPAEHTEHDSTSLWQEHRVLAQVLDVKVIAKICDVRESTEISVTTWLPNDGDALPEWSTLSTATGWQHSGLLKQVGVQPTPYYAGTVRRNAAATTERAVPVTLFVPDATAPGGLRQVARALVATAGATAAVAEGAPGDRKLLEWGASEVMRRSLRTCALVMAHGRPRLTGLVPRRSVIAATDDVTSAPPLLPDVANPRVSSMIQLLRPTDKRGDDLAPQILVARLDQDAVVEVVDAQPQIVGQDAVQRHRLVLNHLVDDRGGPAPQSPRGAAVAKRQRIEFAQAEQDPVLQPAILPLVAPLSAAGQRIVSPMLVDICTAVVRPGDMVHTRWALRGHGTETGPAVELGLRSPRSDNTALADKIALTIAQVAKAQVDGVSWLLHEVTTERRIGPVPTGNAAPGFEVIVVAPHTTAHSNVKLDQDVSLLSLALSVAVHETLEVDHPGKSRYRSMRLLDPLLCGIFPHSITQWLPAGAEVAWAVAAGDITRNSMDVQANQLSNLADIGASADTTARWNKGDQIRVVRLGDWQSTAEKSGGNVYTQSENYTQAAGADLARLLQLTWEDRNVSPHWLLKEGKKIGPLLVLLIRTPNMLHYRVALDVSWHSGGALDQPERVLAVRDGRMLGFGDLAGPAGIRMEHDQYLLYSTAYVLDTDASPPKPVVVRAWLFSAGGGCSAVGTSRSTSRSDAL